MTFTQIKYFLEVANTLNYTKAAKQLFVSQQVVSRQIRLLEEDLQLQLFQKNGKTLKLTPSGKLMYDTWSRQARELSAALSEAALLNNNKNIVNIGILDLRYVIDFCMQEIQFLNESFPNTEFRYFLGDFASIQHAMASGDVDMAITLSEELPRDFPTGQTMLLRDLKLGIFMNRNHPLAQKDSITVSDLDHETFYLLDENTSADGNKRILIDCRLHGFEPMAVQMFNNVHSLEFALVSGNGVTIGFDIFFQDPANHLKMFPLQAVEGFKKADLVVAWQGSYLEPIAKLFCEHTVQV